MEYASVWIRLAAIIIDGLLVIPFYIPMWIVQAVWIEEGYVGMSGFSLFVFILCILSAMVFGFWNAIYRMGKTGQSLGRKFLNIAVLDQNGQPIGVGRAFLREVIGRWVSGLICYIGYLNAFWDAHRQMWHDKMADCYVYNVEDNFS